MAMRGIQVSSRCPAPGESGVQTLGQCIAAKTPGVSIFAATYRDRLRTRVERTLRMGIGKDLEATP